MIPNDYLDGHPAWKAREARREAHLVKMREFLALAVQDAANDHYNRAEANIRAAAVRLERSFNR